jgi:hypothetical protein
MRRPPLLLAIVLVGLVVALALPRRAHACDATAPERYRSAKTVWCVNPNIWASNQADIEKFFPYGDRVVDKLIELFAVSPDDLPYTIEATEPNGGAMTPSHFGPGVAVTGDAFYNEVGGVVGFYGYLLVLHEFVNQWTGLVTGGWPTDWWADHRSPFPNSMDEQIMRALGETAAADIQHGRFSDPQSGDYDPEVVMFNEHFDAYGFAGLARAFALIRADGLKWFDLRDPPNYTDQTTFVSGNPSALLSSYVTAYLSLGAGVNVTDAFVARTVGQKPPSWTDAWDADTTPTTAAVTAIANAHCSIGAAAAAGQSVDAARAALRKGDYASATLAATASCTHDCPSECACSDANACVAPWVDGATPQPDPDGGPGSADGGPGAGGNDGASGSCGCRVGGAEGMPGAFALLFGLGLSGLVLRRARRRA